MRQQRLISNTKYIADWLPSTNFQPKENFGSLKASTPPSVGDYVVRMMAVHIQCNDAVIGYIFTSKIYIISEVYIFLLKQW